MKNIILITILFVLVAGCNTPNNTLKQEEVIPVCISDTARNASCVYLTSDEKGAPVISWCETSQSGKKFFFMAYFDSATGKFANKINIPLEQNAALHEEGMPKVGIKKDGSIIAVYETTAPTEENQWAGDVCYVQSDDKGAVWSPVRYVYADKSGGKSHSFASIARLSNGEIGIAWLDVAKDPKPGGRPVKFASTEGTLGFQNEVVVDPKACECCRTAISCDDAGKITVVYRAITDSIRDIAVSASVDNGKSFTTPVSFSHDEWKINGCPHNGPDIVSGSNINYAAWFTGGPSKGVYYSELGNNNTTVLKKLIAANGRNIQLSLLPDGARVVVYSENIREADSLYSNIVIKRIENEKIFEKVITPGQAHAAYPVIKTFSFNNIVVAWTEHKRIYYKLLKGIDINKEVMEPVNHLAETLPVNISHKLALNTDIVCGMHIDNNVDNTIDAAGKLIGFCSKSCKERYMSDPQKYLSKMK
jgi:YHS domain-containing protein